MSFAQNLKRNHHWIAVDGGVVSRERITFGAAETTELGSTLGCEVRVGENVRVENDGRLFLSNVIVQKFEQKFGGGLTVG